MTSPCHVPFDFSGEFVLPNDSQKILRIKVENENYDVKAREWIRMISLVSQNDKQYYEEKVILSHFPFFEYFLEEDSPSEEKIINLFNEDNIEFI